MTVGEVLNLQQWQQRVGVLRNTDPLIKRGRWQAFLNTTRADGTPIHGTYGVVRWELPSVSIAHEDPDEVIRLARDVEEALINRAEGLAIIHSTEPRP
jgi:hypothetical protein